MLHAFLLRLAFAPVAPLVSMIWLLHRGASVLRPSLSAVCPRLQQDAFARILARSDCFARRAADPFACLFTSAFAGKC